MAQSEVKAYGVNRLAKEQVAFWHDLPFSLTSAVSSLVSFGFVNKDLGCIVGATTGATVGALWAARWLDVERVPKGETYTLIRPARIAQGLVALCCVAGLGIAVGIKSRNDENFITWAQSELVPSLGSLLGAVPPIASLGEHLFPAIQAQTLIWKINRRAAGETEPPRMQHTEMTNLGQPTDINTSLQEKYKSLGDLEDYHKSAGSSENSLNFVPPTRTVPEATAKDTSIIIHPEQEYGPEQKPRRTLVDGYDDVD